MSRLPLHATEEATCEKLRLTQASDVDVYLIGVSRLLPRWRTRKGINLSGLECRTAGKRCISQGGLERPTDENVAVGEIEIEHSMAAKTTPWGTRTLPDETTLKSTSVRNSS